MYLGAGPAGPAANASTLAPFPTTLSTSAPFYLRPSAPGTYTVTVVSDDRCNVPVQDTVAITTQCLSFTTLSGIASNASGLAVTPTNLVASATLTPNAMFIQVTPPAVTAIAPAANATLLLNWGFRLVSRPALTYGDTLPGGVYFAGGSPVSAECLVSPGFSTSAAATSPTSREWNSTFTFNMALQGNYLLQASAMDACVVQTAPTQTLGVTCDAALSVPTFNPPTISNVKWTGSGWPSPNVTLDGALATVTFNYAWFLTSAPATYATRPAVYNSTYRVPASSLMCSQTVPATPWNVTNTLLPTNSNGGQAPFFSAGNAQAATTVGVSTAVVPFTPTVPGPYSLTLQVNSACDHKFATGTFTAVCNNPARFVCGDGTTQTNAPATCGNPNQNANLVSPSTFRYSCVDGTYTPIQVSMLADGGSDPESAADTVVFSVAITNAPPTSWWSAAFVYSTLTYTILVNNLELLSGDFTGFPLLTQAINSSFPSALASSVGIAPSRVVLNATGLPLNLVSPTATLPALGVSLTAIGCYVPGYGRAFQVAVTFAILPDAIYSTSRPTLTASNDRRPLWAFTNVLQAATNSSTSPFYALFTASTGYPLFAAPAPAAGMYPPTDPQPMTQLAPLRSVGPLYFFKGSVALSTCCVCPGRWMDCVCVKCR
jgi:hypothetical protein